MTFYLPGFRSFPKLWKSTHYFELGPATSPVSFFLMVTGNQQRWFSVKTTSLPNSKAMNLLVAKARTRKKGNDSNGQVSPDHYFAAGAAKKRSHLNPQPRDHALPRVSAIQLPTKPLNSAEWDKLKEDFNGRANFEDWVISQMVRSCSSVDVAKSLLAWVAAKNKGIVGYNLLVKYLSICVSHKQTSEVIDVYEIMKAKYKCLESGANTLLIRGLIRSDRWREALLLLEDIKKVMVPSKKNYDDCIQGALLHQDVNMAWSLYQELVGHNLIPLLETLKAFFDFGKDKNDDYYSNKLLDILLYLRNNQLYPGESFAHSIKAWFESVPGRQWKGQFTTIQKSGRCSSCGRTLESIHLSPEEYEFLKEKIMRDVIDGGDQYKKTTPQELKRFENFVNSCPPFDIVIDGLNVAKMFPKSRESQTGDNWKVDDYTHEQILCKGVCVFLKKIDYLRTSLLVVMGTGKSLSSVSQICSSGANQGISHFYFHASQLVHPDKHPVVESRCGSSQRSQLQLFVYIKELHVPLEESWKTLRAEQGSLVKSQPLEWWQKETLKLVVNRDHTAKPISKQSKHIQEKSVEYRIIYMFGKLSDELSASCVRKDSIVVVRGGSAELLGVVSQLAQQNLQLLVLGRKHMLTPSFRWRKEEMEQVQKQAHCFFADNISEDDPFLLYATLNSGNHCKFITKDLMRDHKACLPDARTQHLFFKWQQGHQLAIVKSFKRSKLTFQNTLSYDTVVQTTGDSWHIPYDEDLVQRSSYEVPTKWLCLQGKTQAPVPC